MNKRNLWMLAAILTCSLVTSSCVDDKMDNPPSMIQASLREMIKSDPSLPSHLVSLGDKAGTCAISDEWSAVRTIVEGMDIDPEYVYVYEDYARITAQDDARIQAYIKKTNAYFKDNWQEKTPSTMRP